jgi:hypothetical protein
VHEHNARGRVVDQEAVEEVELGSPPDEALLVARCEPFA